MTQNPNSAVSDPSRFAFVQAGWHGEILEKGRDAFLAEMQALQVPGERIDIYTVPGAYELPLHAKRLAKSGQYDGIVACGFVVNGGIYRHDFVASAVVQGLMQVQLETDVPIFSMVLTPHHFHEHEAHQEFFLQHFVLKGREVAHACVETVKRLVELPRLAEANA